MRNTNLTICLLIASACVAFAQSTDFVAAGVSYNQGATPAVGGTGLYAHKLTEAHTYSVSIVDVLPTSWKPFLTQTNITTGAAQCKTIASMPVCAIGTVGTITTGTNTGWTWTGGGAAVVPIGRGWSVLPAVRVVNPNVSDRRFIVGVLFGWGK